MSQLRWRSKWSTLKRKHDVRWASFTDNHKKYRRRRKHDAAKLDFDERVSLVLSYVRCQHLLPPSRLHRAKLILSSSELVIQTLHHSQYEFTIDSWGFRLRQEATARRSLWANLGRSACAVLAGSQGSLYHAKCTVNHKMLCQKFSSSS